MKTASGSAGRAVSRSAAVRSHAKPGSGKPAAPKGWAQRRRELGQRMKMMTLRSSLDSDDQGAGAPRVDLLPQLRDSQHVSTLPGGVNASQVHEGTLAESNALGHAADPLSGVNGIMKRAAGRNSITSELKSEGSGQNRSRQVQQHKKESKLVRSDHTLDTLKQIRTSKNLDNAHSHSPRLSFGAQGPAKRQAGEA